jgi:hypothetical protein
VQSTFSQRCSTALNSETLLAAATSAADIRCKTAICAADAAQPVLLPDPAADKAGFQAAVREQLQLLLDAWLATLRKRGIRLLLLALGERAALPSLHVLSLHVSCVSTANERMPSTYSTALIDADWLHDMWQASCQEPTALMQRSRCISLRPSVRHNQQR